MALPISGKTYVFICDGARSGNEPKVLNLYYPGSIVNGQNVCLWTKDGSLEQQWKFDGSKLLNMRNTRYALDKYTVAGNANNNNADVWEANDPTNQNIVFEAVSGNIVKIKLASSGLYLTAYNDAHGNNTNKTPTSTGNVFWAAKKTSKLQQWEFVEVGGSSSGGSGNGNLVVGQRPSTLNYNSSCYNNRFEDGQCTWYCYDRAKEVTGKTIGFSAPSGLDAKKWWDYVSNCRKSSTPVSNSIAVWDDGGKYGHVGYVEKVSGSTIYLIEANWGPANNIVDASDGKVKSFTTSTIKSRSGYNILGYLVL